MRNVFEIALVGVAAGVFAFVLANMLGPGIDSGTATFAVTIAVAWTHNPKRR